MYGRSTSGMRTEPSACRLFSRNAISILGGATTVLFSVCAKYLFPSLPFTRIPRRLACASPRLEQLPTSKYFFCLGDHASTSQDFTLRSARSPEQHSSVRTGISRERNRSTVFFPQFIIPFFAFFWFAYNDHFLFFKLMDSVYTTFFDSMSSFFFTEAWRIRSQCLLEVQLHQAWYR